jgi:hypothetical protein
VSVVNGHTDGRIYFCGWPIPCCLAPDLCPSAEHGPSELKWDGSRAIVSTEDEARDDVSQNHAADSDAPLGALQRSERTLVQPARLQLALFDPQVAGELGIAPHCTFLDEPLSVLVPDERRNGSPSGKSGKRRRRRRRRRSSFVGQRDIVEEHQPPTVASTTKEDQDGPPIPGIRGKLDSGAASRRPPALRTDGARSTSCARAEALVRPGPPASSSRSSIRGLFASYVPACKTDGPRCVHFRLGVGCGGDVRSLSREG